MQFLKQKTTVDLRVTSHDYTNITLARLDEDKPISWKDFFSFMNDFKLTFEKTVQNIEENINKKIDTKLEKLVKDNEKKTDNLCKFLEGRMTRIEQDIKRMKFSKMKSDTLGIQKKATQFEHRIVRE